MIGPNQSRDFAATARPSAGPRPRRLRPQYKRGRLAHPGKPCSQRRKTVLPGRLVQPFPRQTHTSKPIATSRHNGRRQIPGSHHRPRRRLRPPWLSGSGRQMARPMRVRAAFSATRILLHHHPQRRLPRCNPAETMVSSPAGPALRLGAPTGAPPPLARPAVPAQAGPARSVRSAPADRRRPMAAPPATHPAP